MKVDSTNPELRFSEFSNPWVKTQLGDFLTFKNGINASKEQYGRGYKFINVLDIIQNDTITNKDIIGSVEVDKKTFLKNQVQYGDILFQRSSETREEVGQSNVYLDKGHDVTFGGFVIRGQAKSKYQPNYMNYLLRTSAARKEIVTKSGGSTRYNVGQETLSKVSVCMSSEVAEQQKIANFLSSVDNKISLLTEKQNLLQHHKKGVMQKLFSQELRFKDDQGINFPDWEEKTIGDTLDIIGGGTPKTDIEEYWNGDINWFTPTEIKFKYLSGSKRKITNKGLKKSSAKLLPKGALLLSTRATVGDIGIALETSSTNQGFQSLVARKNDSNEFFYYWINMNKKELLRRACGSTFLEINKTEISKIILEYPQPAEQHKIANFLGEIDKKIDSVAQQIEQTKTFKKGLLQKMFV